MSDATAERLGWALDAIATAWDAPDRPTNGGGGRRVHTARIPLTAGWLARDAAGRAIGAWAALLFYDGVLFTTRHVDTSDTPAVVALMRRQTVAISHWWRAEEITTDMEHTADMLDEMTADPPPGISIGVCGQDTEDGTACNTPLWASSLTAPITCAGCGRTDTVAGWRAKLTGRPPLVTKAELVDLLAYVGIRTSETGVRLRAYRGTIPAPVLVNDGPPKWDAVAVLAAYLL